MILDDKMESRAKTRDGKLGRTERILKSKDFKCVYKKGRWAKKEKFVMYALPNGLGHNRIGFSISSRNVKLAAKRNKLRRLFREAYRLNKKRMQQGFDMVVIVKGYPHKGLSYTDTETVFLKLAVETTGVKR